MSREPSDKPNPGSAPEDIYGWKWFIVYGLAYVILGGLAVAHVIFSGMVSTFVISTVMLLGALLGFGHARRVRDPETHNCWTISGLFYLLCGIAVMIEPFIGGRLLTLILAAGLAISGLSRIVAGAQLQSTPILVSGTATIVVATVIGVGWQESLLWITAYAIAADLTVQGLTLLIAGEQLHLRRRSVSSQ